MNKDPKITDFQRRKRTRDAAIVREFNTMEGMITAKYAELASTYHVSKSTVQAVVELANGRRK